MAWFGESFANIKGQISNFTKEVLAESPEDEDEINDGGESSELAATKKAFADLQEFCAKQKKEIEQLKSLSDGVPKDQTNADEFHSELAKEKETFEKQIGFKNDEIARLHRYVEELEKNAEIRLNQKIQEIQKEYEAKTWVTVEAELGNQAEAAALLVPERNVVTSAAVSVQTEERLPFLEFSDAGTTIEAGDLSEDDQTTNAEEESYRKELEERCAAYQQDLYILRGELMTIQSDADSEEELRAKFNEDVITILYSDFPIDGHPALSKLKHSRPDSTRAGETVILAAIRQLSSVWRSIIDQKTTLERTVTKLSATATSHQLQIPVTLTTNEDDTVDLSPLAEEELRPQPRDEDSCDSQDFFPPRLDSFGLETILEEERNDEDSKHESDDVDFVHRSKTSSVEVPSRPETCSSETQTTENIGNVADVLRAEILATLEAAYSAKANELNGISEQRQAKILRLETELERLKNHLMEMEDQHTGEMLVCEDQKNELEIQLNTLQQQVSRMMQQSERSTDVKDEIMRLESENSFTKAQCSSFEDQVHKLGTQLQNLNFVLEQFQKEKAAEIDEIRQQLQAEIGSLHSANRNLIEELKQEKDLLARAKSGLFAASQLNVQIEEKSRAVSTLKSQIHEREAEMVKLKSQLDELSNNNVAKIDRYLVKNLVVGYFSTPPDKRQSNFAICRKF
ncbi:myosin-14 isoform X2 [Folsomia candida]|uniref:myosin-14 isoform X2 n=1 Tax=Folsomia candida TaxID=158441 RepID=UPI00160535CC|nr:myosin-14 isoform X2 [Folsomia candida]